MSITSTTVPAYTRTPAWRTLGTLITSSSSEGMSREHIIDAADLNWTVEQYPVTTAVPVADGVSTLTLDRKAALVRRNADGSVQPLGIMGDGFTPLQNDEMFDTLEAIVDESGARYDSAGYIRNGGVVFAAMLLPRPCRIGADDEIGWTLLAKNGHDGTAAFTIAATPVRIRCTNMLRSTFVRAQHTVSVKHTQNARLRIDEARRALRLTFRYEDEWEQWANSLHAQAMNDREFAAIVDRLVQPTPDATERVRERREATRAAILDTWHSETLDNIRGTRWAAYNAISEWEEWSKPVRGGGMSIVETRALRTMERGVGSLTERAARVLTAA